MGRLQGAGRTHKARCSPLPAGGLPAGHRALFDGFKQCLMTHADLIRWTRLQRGGIGWDMKQRMKMKGKGEIPPGPLALG